MADPQHAPSKLTSKLIESMATGQERLEIRDSEVAGLELLVGRGGAKTFRYRYRRADGRKAAVTLGRFDKDAPDLTSEIMPAVSTRLTLKSARRLAASVRGQIARGADPAARVRERKAAHTFRELADEWLTRHATPNKSPRAVTDDRSMLARHILPEIGSRKAGDITKRDIIRLLDAVAAKADARQGSRAGRKMTHRPNRVFELVRAIFRWAVTRDLITIEPTLGLPPPIKTEAPRERVLSPAEIRTLWAALDRAPAQRRSTRDVRRGESAQGEDDIPLTLPIALALKLSLATAQRIGECACISMSELDLTSDAPIWIIPGKRAKNRRSTRVPLSPLALGLIQMARGLATDSPWLFPSPSGSGPIIPSAPTKALARSRTVIGIEDFRAHDLRRTAATQMAELGISPHTLSLILNHASARQSTITSRVYVQYTYDAEKREALERWGMRLEEIVASQ